jgi:TatA/E family protein of Tat protein translocase
MGTIFGVGPLEVIVVLTLVLLVFGPERLPELTRNLGSAIRRLKETYVAFVTEFRDELTPIATEIDAVTRDLRNDLAAIRDAADIRGLIPSINDGDIGTLAKPADTPAQLPAPAPLESVPTPSATSNLVPLTLPSNITGEPAALTSYTNGKPMLGSNYQFSNGNGHTISYGTAAQASANPPPALDSDNPWASIGAPIRNDQIDEDNPWRQ